MRYNGKASYIDGPYADVRVSAVLGLLQYRYIYENEDKSGLFLAGIKIRHHKEVITDLKSDDSKTDDPDNTDDNDQDVGEEKNTSLSEKITKFTEFISDEDNLKVLRSVKDVLFRLIKHIFPKKLTGNITFGLNDPYLTGKVLEIFALFYAAVGNDLEVHPVWDDIVIEGELAFSGRVSIIYMLFQICRLGFNKECMKVWRKYHG